MDPVVPLRRQRARHRDPSGDHLQVPSGRARYAAEPGNLAGTRRPGRAGGSSYPGDVRSAEPVSAGMPSWDIAVPPRPARLAGVAMAGFSDRANDLVDIPLVPHPAVTVIFNLGDTPLFVDDGCGQQQRERVVAGLAPSGARGRGLPGSFECLQVRLSPVVAHAVLGASAELGGTVVALGC